MTQESTENKILSRKDLLLTWWRWICWAQRCYNYERLMGLGFCQAISNVIEKLFPKQEDRQETLTRHMRFYNTENNWGALILGVTCALEEERAMGKNVDVGVIDNLKAALMGPMAGLGDSITQSIVRVILLGISIDLATRGSTLGPIFYVLAFSAYAIIVSYTTFFSGYRMGRSAVTKLLSSEATKSITGALKIVSMMVVGALAASTIKAKTPISVTIGSEASKVSVVQLQAVLDSILPRMLPLAVLLLVLYLLRKQRMSTIKVLLVLFGVGFALTFLNILG